jgi:hypothetical protein
MVDLAVLQSVSYIAGALGVCVAAVYYVLNMRTTLQTRQAQLFMQIYSKWAEEEWATKYNLTTGEKLWDSYDDFKDDLLNNPEQLKKFQSLMRFYEGLGVLVKENLIHIRLVALSMAGDTTRYWEQTGPMILKMRAEFNYPRLQSETEFLYGRLKEYLRSHPELVT